MGSVGVSSQPITARVLKAMTDAKSFQFMRSPPAVICVSWVKIIKETKQL
jgi:hypothetical protein